jgi:hypothetical protein
MGTLNGQILETVTSNPYLGAQLTNTMSWEKQVQKVVTKGNKALSFIRRNAGSCPEEVKKLTILSRSCCSRLQSSLVDIAKYSRLSSANRRILDVMSLPISSREHHVLGQTSSKSCSERK